MRKEIKIPDIAENVDSGLIAGILVSEGDNVKQDQPVVEVETDKASTDIPSPYDGTVAEITVKEGDEVSVNQVIMIIDVANGENGDEEDSKETGGGDDREKESAGGATEEKEESEKDKESEKEESEEDKDTEEDEDSEDRKSEKDKDAEEVEDSEKEKSEDRDSEKDKDTEEGSGGEDIPASPAVRRIAREAGLNLANIKGSGHGNRITIEDIKSAKKRNQEEDKKPGKDKQGGKGEEKDSGPDTPVQGDLPDFSGWGNITKEKMNTIRRVTARNMTASWQQIPQVTQFDEADITAIEEFRQKHKEESAQKGGKLTITAILVRIVAFALQKFPRFNCSLDTTDNSLVMKQYYNIGIAVDTDKGLMVPVIKDVDKQSLSEISAKTAELAKQARESEIALNDLQGGNFTISNLGGIGGTAFTPIVYKPQVGILGVARAAYKQVYLENKFRKRLILPLSLTYDHRVIDGAEGAGFLRWICDVLEDPYALLK